MNDTTVVNDTPAVDWILRGMGFSQDEDGKLVVNYELCEDGVGSLHFVTCNRYEKLADANSVERILCAAAQEIEKRLAEGRIFPQSTL